MKAIKILFIIVFVFIVQTLCAQTETTSIVYGYDAAGNRISRSLTISKVDDADSLKTEITNNGVNPEEITNNAAQQLSETMGNKQITIFPNPTDGILQVNITNLETKDKGEIKLFGVNGAELMKVKTLQESNTINISNKPNGIYMMKVMLNEKETVWKIVKN